MTISAYDDLISGNREGRTVDFIEYSFDVVFSKIGCQISTYYDAAINDGAKIAYGISKLVEIVGPNGGVFHTAQLAIASFVNSCAAAAITQLAIAPLVNSSYAAASVCPEALRWPQPPSAV